MGGIAAIAPILSAVGSVAGAFLQPEPPAPAPPPPAPAPAPAPPPPEESRAQDVATEEAVVDTEAARVRAQKRRKAAEDKKLFALEEEDRSTSLTKSLLGS